MNIKMCCFDLDDTLLNEEKQLSDYTLDVLKRYKQQGGLITIATGRTLDNAMPYYQQLNANYLINQNGMNVYYDGQFIMKNHYNQDKVKALIDRLKVINNSTVALAYPTYIVSNNLEYGQKVGHRYSTFNEVDTAEIQKISIFTTTSHNEVKSIDYNEFDCFLLPNKYDNNYFVIMDKSIDKANGLQFICNQLGISNNEVATFGDDYNDLNMIKNFYGVAVDNADSSIKDVAKEVCDSYLNDGPAKWIEKNLLR